MIEIDGICELDVFEEIAEIEREICVFEKEAIFARAEAARDIDREIQALEHELAEKRGAALELLPEYVKAQTYDIKYPELRARRLIPLDT